MRDGVSLNADLYVPEGPGPFPVLLMRSPYNKTQGQDSVYAHPSWYARRGYMVVVQDVRGRWTSGGDWYPFAHEAEDGYDTVEWAARLPKANGRVGMYGLSYVGATQ
ncbi:MAG TPA: CocE/NonD family hydrolase, partial [bacterium]|nr:CocE/NonD family hydrolase [bacterium]